MEQHFLALVSVLVLSVGVWCSLDTKIYKE